MNRIKRIFFIQGNKQDEKESWFFIGNYHSRNSVLNKSFDVLPQIKNDDTTSDNSVSEIIIIIF